MIRTFVVNLVVIMITMLIVGVVYVAMTGGSAPDILPILVGAAVAGVPISAYFAWKGRGRR